MSGVLTAGGEMSGILVTVKEMSDKILSGKSDKNCLLLVAYLHQYGCLIASS